MKRLYLASAVALLAAFLVTGCSAPGRAGGDSTERLLVADYEKTWDAMYTVMQKHFKVMHKSRSEGVVEAAPVRNDGKQGQAETRVSAKIFPNKRGGYDVEVRACNYIEISEPYALSGRIGRYEWRQVGYDSPLETRLRNEIDSVRYQGLTHEYQNQFMESPRTEIIVD